MMSRRTRSMKSVRMLRSPASPPSRAKSLSTPLPSSRAGLCMLPLGGGLGLRAVALLVLLARPAVARIVAPDLRSVAPHRRAVDLLAVDEQPALAVLAERCRLTVRNL